MTPNDLLIKEYADPDVILDPKKIRRKYILSWFFVDMISTIPLDYILQLIYGNVDPKGMTSNDLRDEGLTLNDLWPLANSMRAMKLVRFAKILSLLRLLRLSRLIRYVHQWEEVLSTTSKFFILIGPFLILLDQSELIIHKSFSGFWRFR